MEQTRDTEELLALAEVEHRLRRIRTRFNLYTVQHNFYILGTVLALSAAGLVVSAFILSSLFFILITWLLLAVLAVLLFVFVRRVVTNWSDLPTAAYRIDTRAGLKERLSTLAPQIRAAVRGNLPPSRLWPHLIAENTARLPEWEVKKVAPSRVPWSFFPFVAALLLTLVAVFLPLLSSPWGSTPFSLDNMQTILSDLPDRIDQMLERQLSLRPEPGKSTEEEGLFGENGDLGEAGDEQADHGGSAARGTERGRKARSFASLPEGLQKAILQALRGPQDKRRDGEGEEIFLPNPRLARRYGDGKNLSGEPARRVLGGSNPADGEEVGEGMQLPAQGSGIQQLGRARLDRKNARGAFQPANPQAQRGGSQSGGSGAGAGTGTDPRLFGDQVNLGGNANTFQLSLNATYEKGTGSDGEIDEEGGAVEKSGKGLSQRQSLDDAIRKAQVPPEYEEIVKSLFSRGELP